MEAIKGLVVAQQSIANANDINQHKATSATARLALYGYRAGRFESTRQCKIVAYAAVII